MKLIEIELEIKVLIGKDLLQLLIYFSRHRSKFFCIRFLWFSLLCKLRTEGIHPWVFPEQIIPVGVNHLNHISNSKHLQDIPRANHLSQSKSHFHIFAMEPENRVFLIASVLSFSYWAWKSPALMAVPRNSEFKNSVMES